MQAAMAEMGWLWYPSSQRAPLRTVEPHPDLAAPLLTGLDSTIQQVFGAEHPPPEVNASAADATTDAGDTTSKEPTLHQRVKNAVTLVYLNSVRAKADQAIRSAWFSSGRER
jgi:hypothetical protein